MSIHPNSPPRRDSGRDQEEVPSNASYQARREEVFRQRREREKRQREEEALASQQRHSETNESNREGGNLFEDGDRAINEWTSKAAASKYEDLLVQDDHSADDVVQTLFAALNRMRAERDTAISVVEALATERAKIRVHIASEGRSSERLSALFRKVGLDENCPDFLLKAARQAFRKQFHPDLHPVHRRGEAEHRFKEAEAVFEEIKRLRGP
jgi:hypothetical protein